jgi:uncharacterized membrane protein YkoI
MIRNISYIFAAILSFAVLNPAEAQRGNRSSLRQDVEQGKVKSLREIEAAVLPRMRGMQYLGPEYDPEAQVYRLKFIDKDRVIFVDVDAKTGNIISQR